MPARQFRDSACGHLREGVRRIGICLDLIGEEDLWRDPGPQLVSVGNLILHLRGNVTQYILRGLGGSDLARNRELEFTGKPCRSREELLRELSDTITGACGVIERLRDGDLERDYTIQGFTLSGVGVVMHVVEHFSYHVGQITFATKLMSGRPTDYYAGRDLNRP